MRNIFLESEVLTCVIAEQKANDCIFNTTRALTACFIALQGNMHGIRKYTRH